MDKQGGMPLICKKQYKQNYLAMFTGANPQAFMHLQPCLT